MKGGHIVSFYQHAHCEGDRFIGARSIAAAAASKVGTRSQTQDSRNTRETERDIKRERESIPRNTPAPTSRTRPKHTPAVQVDNTPVDGDLVRPLLLLPQLVQQRLPGHLLELLLVARHVRPRGRRRRGKRERRLERAHRPLAFARPACRPLSDVERRAVVPTTVALYDALPGGSVGRCRRHHLQYIRYKSSPDIFIEMRRRRRRRWGWWWRRRRRQLCLLH